jgi:hypothetical protein
VLEGNGVFVLPEPGPLYSKLENLWPIEKATISIISASFKTKMSNI